jgi:hypothetical protein
LKYVCVEYLGVDRGFVADLFSWLGIDGSFGNDEYPPHNDLIPSFNIPTPTDAIPTPALAAAAMAPPVADPRDDSSTCPPSARLPGKGGRILPQSVPPRDF